MTPRGYTWWPIDRRITLEPGLDRLNLPLAGKSKPCQPGAHMIS